MNKYIKDALKESIIVSKSNVVFFKTGVGEYAENDKFIGVPVPRLRIIAKQFCHISHAEIQDLIESRINEERLLVLFIVIDQYQKADDSVKSDLYQWYLHNIHQVNNWNLVDASAHLIVGAYLHNKKRDMLLVLAQSEVMWERRIAIVATWYFIRKNDFEWTMKIAHMLLNDSHDLIHKAVGWMLREVGKRNQNVLVQFLERHACQMPRTMLRYAIEKFSEDQRKSYLAKK